MKRLLLLMMTTMLLMAVPVSAQLVQGKHGSDDFKIGIAGYSYRNFSIDDALKLVSGLGVKYMSIKDFWLPLTSTKEQMEAFKAKCASYGVDGYILGPIYMKSKAEVDRAFSYVQRYGQKLFIGVPDYALIDYVKAKVKETGIRVAIHTHGPDGAAFPDIRTVVEKVKDPHCGIGCCLDLGHCTRMGEDISKEIVKYKDWIYDVHIKDETAASKAGQTCEMGRGVMDFKSIVRAFRRINYQGVLSLEFEKDGKNPHPGVAESIGYLRGVCDAIR